MKGHQGRRRMFLLQLGQQLAQKHMESRAKVPNMPTYVKDALKDCGVEPEQSGPSNQQQETNSKKRGRCYLCPRKEDKKSRIICKLCTNFVCEKHRKVEGFMCNVCHNEN